MPIPGRKLAWIWVALAAVVLALIGIVTTSTSEDQTPDTVVLRGAHDTIVEATIPALHPLSNSVHMSVPTRGALLAPGNRPGVRYCDYGYQTTIDIWCPADGQGILRARITGTPGQRIQVATILGGDDKKVPVFVEIEEP